MIQISDMIELLWTKFWFLHLHVVSGVQIVIGLMVKKKNDHNYAQLREPMPIIFFILISMNKNYTYKSLNDERTLVRNT